MSAEDQRLTHRLADMARFADEAAWVVHFGRDAYVSDDPQGALLRNAGERILIKIATVVEKLPETYKGTHPQVQWVAISRLRNLVAHHYDKVNDDLIWVSLERDVPQLIQDLGLTSQ